MNFVIPPPPPAPHEMRAGAKLVAGLGFSTVRADLDFETYSEAGYVWNEAEQVWDCLPGAPQGKKGISVVGAEYYARHPSTQVLSLSYNLKDGRGSRLWLPGNPLPEDLFQHVQRGELIEAHRSSFEFLIWKFVCVPQHGFPPLPLEQLRCSMAKSRSSGLPGKLEAIGKALNLSVQKDKDGERLLKKFSMPRNPTKKDPRRRILPSEDPNDAWNLYRYNITDIHAESAVSAATPDLIPDEVTYWLRDQRINHRGVAVDMPLIDACISILHQAEAKYNPELALITGGKVTAGTQREKLVDWLRSRGMHVESLDAEHLDEYLAPEKERDTPPDVWRALSIRAIVASSSVKKVYAMKNMAVQHGPNHWRLHWLYEFHGAHTGRPTGSGVQPTNMPKSGPNVYRCGYQSDGKPAAHPGCGRWHGSHTVRCPWCLTIRMPSDCGPSQESEWNPSAMEDCIEVIVTGSLGVVEQFFGFALKAMAGILRGIFCAAPGYEFVSSDFTAVEGVVIACMAGEQWRIDAYAKDEPMYVISASKAFHVPVEEMLAHKKKTGQHHPLRQVGKGLELACGFGGWIGSAKNFNVPGTDDEIKTAILAWRAASPAIVHYWGGQFKDEYVNGRRYSATHLFGLEGMAVAALQNPGVRFRVDRLDGGDTGVSFIFVNGDLFMRLPSGRDITYKFASLRPSTRSFRGGFQIVFWGVDSKTKSWREQELYGGLLSNNATQGTARELQMHAIENLERDGYPVVMHTYDENVGEVPLGFGGVEHFESRMTDTPPFARGWPIKAAGGWRASRYRKA